MRVVQCQHREPNAMPFYAAIEGDELTALASSPFSEPIRLRHSEKHSLGDVRLLPPVIPSKVVAIGKNYRDHIEEMGGMAPAEPLVFLKPSSSVIGPGAPILLPALSERVEHEAELAIVIRSRCRRVAESEASAVILGVTALNDVTARDLQKLDGQWSRAKGFDTFCPIGPAIAFGLDPGHLRVTSRINGETRQDSSTDQLVFGVGRLIAHITAFMTLYPGDVIATGTPGGVGPLLDGDTIEVEVEGVGTLTNPVMADPDA
ncbi:fumarylacetoacetate hydrolase family protein [Candidatus Sumerlaeota bacterium]|nr:fumarylacetoacetate hydrolase family protein [Candidatus Sumerlaeota bacterium]